MINWEDGGSHVLCNPRMPQDLQEKANRLSTVLPGHIWLTTSSRSKWVALSKEAILTSADAVNRHLESDANDVWLHPLPDFHVGGLGIRARAHLSGSSIIRMEKWNPETFQQKAGAATLTSLVPTQIYDLVIRSLPAPLSLRAVIVGGGALPQYLYRKARDLGWPILPSYGLSECCSQVATATAGDSRLKVLSHVQAKCAPSGRMVLKSSSLLTTYAYLEDTIRFSDPKVEGWFETEDCGKVEGGYLEIIGRANEVVKILGENVNLRELESLLEKIQIEKSVQADFCLLAQSDPRAGSSLHLFITSDAKDLLEEYHKRVMPYEQIHQVYQVSHIPRSELGKPLKKRIRQEFLES